jgi:hypothetical protein
MLVLVICALACAVAVPALAPSPSADQAPPVPVAHVPGAHAGSGQMTLAMAPSSLQWAASSLIGSHDPRYAAVRRDGGWVTTAGHLSTTYGASGPVVHAGGAWMGLRLLRVGAQPAGASAITAAANVVTYRRPGVTEWYRNGPVGLEQGFTVSRPGTRQLVLRVAGDMTARPMGAGIAFSRPGLPAVRYGGLRVVDARGRVLPSRMKLAGGTVTLSFAGSRITYPVRIDPYIQNGGGFARGDSVAISQDGLRAVIGNPNIFTSKYGTAGGAYILHRTQSGWLTDIEFTPAVFDAEAGQAVALSANGTVVVVGAPNAANGVGAAFIFVRHANGQWSQQGPKLTPSDESGAGFFGSSVAMSGDGNEFTVSAPQDGSPRGTGAVWMFTRTAGIWSQQGSKIVAAGESGSGVFGQSLAMSSDGDTALIGAPGNAGDAGAAWVFTRSGSTWNQGPELTSVSHAGPAGQFGTTVSLSSAGTRALIGEPFYGRGGAWIFNHAGSSWIRSVELTIDNATPNLLSGPEALSGDGTVAMIGTPEYNGGEGAIWSWHNTNGNTWRQISGPGQPPPGQVSLGESLALSSDGRFTLEGAGEYYEMDLSGAPCVYPDQAELPDGLLGYWRLGESSGTVAHDELKAHNGAYTGGFSLGLKDPGAVAGSANTSVGLDGSTGQVTLPSLGSSSDWTIAGWTNLDPGATGNTYGNNALYASRSGVRVLIRPTGYTVDDLTGGTDSGQLHGSTDSNLGVWVFWAVVRNGSSLTVYRNGQEIATTSDAEPGPSNLNGSIGADGTSYHLHGRVDELAVYGAALHRADVVAQYQCSGWG